MEYQEFLKELDKYLGKLEWIGKHQILRKGTKAGDDKELQAKISNSNRMYFNMESEELLDDFVFVEEQKGFLVCRFRVRDMFEAVGKNGWKAVDNWLHENFDSADAKQKEIIGSIHDYEKMKGKLRVRLINFADNSMKLKGVVYRIVGDMALELCISFGYRPEGHLSAKVAQELLKDWKIDEDTAYRIAMQNTQVEAKPLLNKRTALAQNGVFCVTTSKMVNGATALVYPGVKEKLAEIVSGDYYVVFVDTEMAYIHSVSRTNPKELLDILQGYRAMAGQTQLLSRKIYRYHRDTKELEMLSL